MTEKAQALFDVVIYEVATRKVTNLAGKNLPLEGGFHTLQKRLETVIPRLNDRYACLDVPAGTVKIGDTLP